MSDDDTDRSHHPGPPQFLAVGETVQLAPRDPDPDATYTWRVADAPPDSELGFDDDAVQNFEPAVPGRYRFALEAPDGTHYLTVHVFHGDRMPAGSPAGASGYSGQASGGVGPTGQSGAVSGSGSGSAAGESEPARGRPRVRLGARVEDDEAVVTADVRPHPDDDRDPDEFEVVFLLDDRDDVEDEALAVSGHEARLPLSAIDDRVRVHAVAVGDAYSVADTVELRRTATDGGTVLEDDNDDGTVLDDDVDGRADGGTVLDDDVDGDRLVESAVVDDATLLARNLNDPPQWAREATVYEIYVRGFADADAGQSQFDAIADRLDYLADLGVDTLWLTPVLENDDAPHGYNITDFFAIADDLGGRADYERFVDAAHDRGMNVLFDFVANHSARQHPHFEDAYRNPASRYREWYEWQDSGEPGTYFDWQKIANFDFTSLAVRRYLLDAAAEWMQLVDGFRCDMAWAVPRNFWQELRDMAKAHDPEFLLLDETIPYIPDFHEGMFDVHFDTTTYFALRQVGRGDQPAEALLEAVEGRTESGFPDHAEFLLYAENHDETRYVVECGDAAARAAAGALFTLPGVPMVYAGQEIGQRGRRDAIAWDHAREAFQDHFRRLVDLRDSTTALGPSGELSQITYDAPEEVVVFERATDEESYVVALNFDAGTATVGLDRAVDATDLVTGEDRAAEGGVTVDDVAVFRAE